MGSTFVFTSGTASVPAHQHINPDGSIGGWVAETATVENTVYLSLGARVYGSAQVFGYAKVFGNAEVYDNARVFGNAEVYDNARVFGYAKVFGNAEVYDNARVFGYAKVYDNARVFGNARVYDNARVFGYAKVFGNARKYDFQPSKEALVASFESDPNDEILGEDFQVDLPSDPELERLLKEEAQFEKEFLARQETEKALAAINLEHEENARVLERLAKRAAKIQSPEALEALAIVMRLEQSWF